MYYNVHQHYKENVELWAKWRICYEGGQLFKDRFLFPYGKREKEEDFQKRKLLSYTPVHAKAAIKEVHNALYQRMPDIARNGGTNEYQAHLSGDLGGVDKRGSGMSKFIDREIISELLVMRRVGIFVDNSRIEAATTLAESSSPYLYPVKTEKIVDWEYEYYTGRAILKRVVIHDIIREFDDIAKEYSLIDIYRHYFIDEDGTVSLRIENNEGKERQFYRSNLRKIPFVILEISTSLMADICDYQIALLNLASADISMAWKSNFPIYTEQASSHSSKVSQGDGEREAGGSLGLLYPSGSERPGFINPSPEPLRVSMEKQQRMVDEIRTIVGLTVSSVTSSSSNVSADAREFDLRSLEAGLANIGTELETAENIINAIWAEYEGTTEITKTTYPIDYSLKNNVQRLAEAQSWYNMLFYVPSSDYFREINKKIVQTLFHNRIPNERLLKMYGEIDKAKLPTFDPNIIKQWIDDKVLSRELYANELGIPGQPEKALEENDTIVSSTVKAQTAAANQPVSNSETSEAQNDTIN